jgi:hypothetical protein
MRLTNRDIEIINFIETNTGATIEQMQKLYFPTYDVAANRLKVLADNKFLKVQVHPVLGKKVYYIRKLPSYHALIITNISILLKDKVKFMQREYKIKNNFVDCIFITHGGKLLITEIDIFNRTKEKKIKEVIASLEGQNIQFEFWVICKHTPKGQVQGVKYIRTGEEEEELRKSNYT